MVWSWISNSYIFQDEKVIRDVKMSKPLIKIRLKRGKMSFFRKFCADMFIGHLFPDSRLHSNSNILWRQIYFLYPQCLPMEICSDQINHFLLFIEIVDCLILKFLSAQVRSNRIKDLPPLDFMNKRWIMMKWWYKCCW